MSICRNKQFSNVNFKNTSNFHQCVESGLSGVCTPFTYRCLIFSLVEYDKKGKEKEVITFFVTDDLNHLPVRLDLFLNFGSAKAFLNNVTGNRHPLTSIVK